MKYQALRPKFSLWVGGGWWGGWWWGRGGGVSGDGVGWVVVGCRVVEGWWVV